VDEDIYYKGKSTRDLLKEIRGTAQVGSATYEQMRLAIFVNMAEGLDGQLTKLTTAIDGANRSTSRLGTIGIVLNCVLVLATIVVAIATWRLK